MLLGKLFQTEAAGCLNPRDAKLQLTQNFYKLYLLMTIEECELVGIPARDHEGRQVDQRF